MTEAQPRFRALAFYTTTVEPDHVGFATAAIGFYTTVALARGFEIDFTTDWDRLNDDDLSGYQVVVWINHFPQTEPQRRSFEEYMADGGAWLGFHVSAYNDRHTKWPWFVDFLGGAVFHSNNWPALPARLTVDDNRHPATARLPATFTAPADEWYSWQPSARLSPDVRVFVTLDASNYPLGVKNLLTEGDVPVVWANTKYRMLYINMGHTEKRFDSEVQNRLFEDAILWLGERDAT